MTTLENPKKHQNPPKARLPPVNNPSTAPFLKLIGTLLNAIQIRLEP